MSKKCQAITISGKKCRVSAENDGAFCRHHVNSVLKPKKIIAAKVIKGPEKNEIFFGEIESTTIIENIYNAANIEKIKLLSSTCRYLYNFCNEYFQANPRYVAFEKSVNIPGIMPLICPGVDCADNKKYTTKIMKSAVTLFCIKNRFYPYTDTKNIISNEMSPEASFYHQITNYKELLMALKTSTSITKIVECKLGEKEEKMKHYVFEREANRIAEMVTKNLLQSDMKIMRLCLGIEKIDINLARYPDFLKRIKEILSQMHINLRISIIDEKNIYFSDYPLNTII